MLHKERTLHHLEQWLSCLGLRGHFEPQSIFHIFILRSPWLMFQRQFTFQSHYVFNSTCASQLLSNATLVNTYCVGPQNRPLEGPQHFQMYFPPNAVSSAALSSLLSLLLCPSVQIHVCLSWPISVCIFIQALSFRRAIIAGVCLCSSAVIRHITQRQWSRWMTCVLTSRSPGKRRKRLQRERASTETNRQRKGEIQQQNKWGWY